MQATVQRFDPDSGTGSVVTDDGLVLNFSAEAFASSGLRMLRTGQRVSLSVINDPPEIVELWLESVGYVPSRSSQFGPLPRS